MSLNKFTNYEYSVNINKTAILLNSNRVQVIKLDSKI